MINYITNEEQLLKYRNSEEVFVVGGGPSLLDIDLKTIKGKDVISVTHSIYHLDNPTFHISVDYCFYACFGQFLPEFEKKKTFKLFVASEINNNYEYSKERLLHKGDDIDYKLIHLTNGVIKSAVHSPFSKTLKNKMFANAYNSGYSGIQLAYILGYKRIYLLGYDMTKINGKAQAFYDNNRIGDKKYHEHYWEYFAAFKEALLTYDKKRTEIVSCSSVSLLNEFIKFVPLTEIL